MPGTFSARAEARQISGAGAGDIVAGMNDTVGADGASPQIPVAGQPVVEIVLPVYNEQATLEASVRQVQAVASATIWVPWRITIADNASTDGSRAIARRLASELAGVRFLRLDFKGRGLALRAAWLGSPARVLVYMDIDLSTDLAALPPLIAPLLSGHSAISIGSRLAQGARISRGPKREVISRCYNKILRFVLRTRFTDAQCGFKAIRADVARHLLPHVRDNSWFFDTELLVLAERAGLRIQEIPVDWVDDPDSRVAIVATAAADLCGVARVAASLSRREFRRQLRTIGAEPLPAVALAAALPAGSSISRTATPTTEHVTSVLTAT
jgi:glycosyltransferase involved in cell wall biosynthesis